MKKRILLLGLILLFCIQGLVSAADIETELVKIPFTVENETLQLDAKIYKPVGKGPFPLLVLNHGTPRLAEDRAKTNASVGFKNQCETFANLGFTVVFVVRRGFGSSEGQYAENKVYSDGARNYTKSGLEAAKDICATVKYMKTKQYVDSKRIILLGQSTGGHSVIAAGSLHIDGVIGIVNFAGGRGSYAPDLVRDEKNLINSMAHYGKTSHVPTLWLYSVNDHYFGPSLAQAMVNAYVDNGGQARFITLPAFGTEGHSSFVRARDNWYSHVINFLSEIGAIRESL